MNTARKSFRYGETTVTVERRTLLSDARCDALLAQLVPVLPELVATLQQDTFVLDYAVSKYARLVSQTVEAEHLPIALIALGDDTPTLHAKCLAYLTDLDPKFVEVWESARQTVDASWNAPELLPTPPEDLPKNA